MKRILLPTLLISSLLFSSCEKGTNLQPAAEVQTESVSYLAQERIRIPKGVDPVALQITDPKSAGEYAAKALGSSGGKSKNLSSLDPYALQDILKEVVSKYPVFDFSLDLLPEDQFNKIKQDFPDIKTQEEAYNKRETIALYYENLKRHDFLEKVRTSNVPLTSAGKTTSLFNPERLPGGWFWLAATYTEACGVAGEAAQQVEDEVIARFGCNPRSNDSDESNAFQHSTWCGLIARKLIQRGGSKQNATGQASIVTAAYECVSVNFDPTMPSNIYMVYTKGINNAMDLYNNSVGRSYVYDKTTFGAFGIRKEFPSEQRVIDEMYGRLCQQRHLMTFHNAYWPHVPYDPNTDPAPLLNLVQADHHAAWETLYRHTVSGWTGLVTIKHGCLCPQ